MVNSLHARVVVKESVLTPDRILDAVSEQLERTGIAGLRLRDVAERLNVSVPSLYRFFEDREAMIAAACVRDFAAQTFEDLDELEGILASAVSAEDYELGFRKFMESAFGEDHRRGQWRKLAAMAATRHDPQLVAQIAEVQAQFATRVAQLYAAMPTGGLAAAPVNPLALAFALHGLSMAPLFAEVARADVTTNDFSDVFVLIHRALTT